jgi:hypothetical protein
MTKPTTPPQPPRRAETGPIRFGDDWPGTFVRGDNAFHYAAALRRILDEAPAHLAWDKMTCQALLQDLEHSNVHHPDHHADALLPFQDCMKETSDKS